jgi:hypothetical protein
MLIYKKVNVRCFFSVKLLIMKEKFDRNHIHLPIFTHNLPTVYPYYINIRYTGAGTFIHFRYTV